MRSFAVSQTNMYRDIEQPKEYTVTSFNNWLIDKAMNHSIEKAMHRHVNEHTRAPWKHTRLAQ